MRTEEQEEAVDSSDNGCVEFSKQGVLALGGLGLKLGLVYGLVYGKIWSKDLLRHQNVRRQNGPR